MLQLRKLLKQGFLVLKSSNRLLFVAALLFVFPFLFLYITNTFIETAERNIDTAEKRSVAILHDAIVVLLSSYQTNPNLLDTFLATTQQEMPDVEEIRITKKTPEGYQVIRSHENEREGSFESVTDMYRLAQPHSSDSLIFPFVTASGRSWQVLRAAEIDSEVYYILSEHSFANVDSVMDARKKHAYLGLSAIFAFLIALAFWFGKQIDWQKRHAALATQIKERELFANMLAHEFRTRLTAIRGYSRFLAESQTISDKEKTFVDAVQQSTERLLALINDFLEVARIQSGNMNLEKSMVDIQPTILAVIAALEPIAKEKNLLLSYHQLAVPVALLTDTKRLYQVLQNLISNSLKYTETGSVEVALDSAPKAVQIRIKDSGMGISAEDQQKLFAPFARVGGVEHTKITGTGLGMWITKQLVEALGGSIRVESIKDVGTHVVLTFKR